MKYIDTDKLKTEIERHIKHYEKLDRDDFKNGELYICQELLSFIESLPQEPTDVDWTAEIIKAHEENGWMYPDNLSLMEDIARYFWNKGYNARKKK